MTTNQKQAVPDVRMRHGNLNLKLRLRGQSSELHISVPINNDLRRLRDGQQHAGYTASVFDYLLVVTASSGLKSTTSTMYLLKTIIAAVMRQQL